MREWLWRIAIGTLLASIVFSFTGISVGVPNIVIEGAAVALLCVLVGERYGFKGRYLLIIAAGAVLAIVVDPTIWKWQNILTSEETEIAIISSIVVNGTLGLIASAAYLLGTLLHTSQGTNTNPR